MSEGTLLPPVLVRLMGDMTQLRGTLAEARSQVNGTAAGMKSAGVTAAAGMAKMGRSVSLVGAGVAVASVKMAGDFQAETMVLHTAAGETVKGLSVVRQGILNIAKGTGTGIQNLTDGMYTIEKAGYRGADGLKVETAAAQGAREENASLSSVTNAMTSIMASYHLKATDSVRVMNGMKTAAGEGKMTMEEFASSLSTVLPIASANKISFGEVAGALATLTQHGTSAREGTQELAATIRQLAAPNNVAIQEMQRLGLSSTDVSTNLGKRGLTGTLDLLSQTVLSKMGPSGTVLMSSFNSTKQAAADADTMVQKMPKSLQGVAESYAKGTISLGDWRQKLKSLPPQQANLLSQYATLQNKTKGFSAELKKGGPAAQTYTEAIKKMTGGAIGMNTTLMLTGENMTGFKDRTEKVNASFNHASKSVEGWDATQKLFNVRLAKAKETIQVTAIEIGTRLIPVVTAAVDWFGRHKDAAMALAAVIGGVLALSVVAYVGKLVIGAGKVVVGFGKMGLSAVQASARVVQGFRSAQVAESQFSGVSGTLGGKLRKGFDGAVSGAKAATKATADFGKKIGSLSASAGRAAWAGMVSGAKATGTALKAASLAAVDFSKKMLAGAVAGLRAAAAWTAQKIALVATTVAEKAAALAQWALNIAMDANPMVWIVLAIMALVAVIVIIATKTTWFQTIWSVAWAGMKAAGLAAWGFLKAMFADFVSGVGVVVGFVQAHWPLLLAILTGPIGMAVYAIVHYWSQISGAFSSAYHTVVSTGLSLVGWVTGLPGRILSGLSRLGGMLSSWASAAFGRAKSAAVSQANSLNSWLGGLPGRMLSSLGNTGKLLYGAGTSIIHGLIGGIESGFETVKSKLHSLTSLLPSWKGPPARDKVLLHGAGQMIIDGLVNGMASRFSNVKASAGAVAQATIQSFSEALGISSPSTVFRQLGIYVNEGLVDGLTGSTANVKAATRRVESVLTETRNRVSDLLSSSAAKGKKGAGLRDWVADHLKTLSGLESYAKREDAALRKLAAQRDSAATKLKAAQSKLTALQKSWSSEKSSVASGIMQNTSIVTASPDDSRAVNSFDVVAQMQAQVKAATEFAQELEQLRKKGLSSGLIQELATAGVDQAGATAQALAAGTSGQIQQINRLQANLAGSANDTGTAVADAMYGAGIKSAQGLVKGLQSQESAIEAQMMRIAKSMQSAIKKALGIHSPSRVFASLGQFIPQGLAQGIQDAAHHATSAATSLAGSVMSAGSYGGVAMAGAGGGGATYVTQVYVTVQGTVTSEKKLVDTIETALTKRAKNNPGAGFQPVNPWNRRG